MNFDIPNQWSDLLNEGKLEGILSLYEEKALLMATFDADPLMQPAQRREYFENFMNRPGAGVEVDPSTLYHKPLSSNLYQATGFYTFFYEEDGVLVRQNARFTFIVSIKDSHLILHHHSSLVPNANSE